MKANKLTGSLSIISGLVNVYLLDLPSGLTLIDTGFPRDTTKILKGIAALGYPCDAVRHILLTHAHPDHIGGAAEIQQKTGAQVYAHRIDAPIVESGGPFRPIRSAPGLRNTIVVSLLKRLRQHVPPVPVDGRLEDGTTLPFCDDLAVIHIPGHCAGQVAFHWRTGRGVLFAADACINRKGMVLAAAQEDVDEARRSVARLAKLSFEIACFGHGRPIMSNADHRFKERWL